MSTTNTPTGDTATSQTVSECGSSNGNLDQSHDTNCCENCGKEGLVDFINKPGHKLKQCPSCKLLQKGFLESQLVYEGDYHQYYSSRLESKVRTALIRLGSIAPYLQTDRPKMLDIGCSVGATVVAGNRLGWDAYGTDVSSKAVELCQARDLNCDVIVDGKLPYEDNTFDLVTNWHVIEHVKDVKETLHEWQRVLKPGGVMILETPDSSYLKARIMGPKYRKFWPADHLYTFNRDNLTSIIETCGFEMLPGRLIGSWTTLPAHLTAYAIGYRTLRTCQRTVNLCKSIELCCRKPNNQSEQQSIRAAA